MIAQDLNDENEFLDTPEAPEAMDNSFMGYTISVGHFNNDSAPGHWHCRNAPENVSEEASERTN